MMKFEYDLKDHQGLMTEIHINKKMVKMLGFEPKDFYHLHFTNLGFLLFFRSNNWISFYKKLLVFIYETKNKSMRLDTDDFYCVNSKGKKVVGNFLLVKQKIIVGEIPTEEIYFSFIHDDQDNESDMVSSQTFWDEE